MKLFDQYSTDTYTTATNQEPTSLSFDDVLKIWKELEEKFPKIPNSEIIDKIFASKNGIDKLVETGGIKRWNTNFPNVVTGIPIFLREWMPDNLAIALMRDGSTTIINLD